MRVCQKCGAEFHWERKPGQRGRTKIYCSDRCSWRARYVPREPAPRDPVAHSAASSVAATARWARLSPEERSAAASALALARYTPEQRARAAERKADLAARRQVPCPYCGDPVGRAGRVKCPRSECHLSHQAARMSLFAAKRRLQIEASPERFAPVEVFERDGWTCGICDLPVDPSAKWPEPDSVSLDHIIPLSRGGEHTRANTQCAHLYCNTVKGASVAV